MKFNKESLNLYLVTDQSWIGDRTLHEDVEEALKNGVSFLQLREKNLDKGSFLKLAVDMKALSANYNIPFVINDDVEIALASDADGVHIGQSDMVALQAREKLGNQKILGVSVRTVEQAKEAEKMGADYLGVGAVFSTTTKLDAADVSYEELSAICSEVNIPVVAIGGINEKNIEQLKGSGVYGVAVISAILAKKNIGEATKTLSDKCRQLF